MNGAVLLADLGRAEFRRLSASGGGGSYGTPLYFECELGPHMVFSDGDVGVRDSSSVSMRTDGAGATLEVPVTSSTPLLLQVRSGRVVVAAVGGACTVWLVPLVPPLLRHPDDEDRPVPRGRRA